MELVPILETIQENQQFIDNPECKEHLEHSIHYYQVIGFNPPWIGYYVKQDGSILGSGAFKGQPIEGKVEIAYMTFPQYQKQGVATHTCRLLVELALAVDPSVNITARTLPEQNTSTRILERNGFKMTGVVVDPEDGEVWEWIYQA